MALEGEATNDGPWVDEVVGLNDVRSDLAMMRTPDGHGRLELAKCHTPRGQSRAGKRAGERAGPTPHHVRGRRRRRRVARLRRHGGELVGEIARYEDVCRIAFVRGPNCSSSGWPRSSAARAPLRSRSATRQNRERPANHCLIASSRTATAVRSECASSRRNRHISRVPDPPGIAHCAGPEKAMRACGDDRRARPAVRKLLGRSRIPKRRR